MKSFDEFRKTLTVDFFDTVNLKTLNDFEKTNNEDGSTYSIRYACNLTIAMLEQYHNWLSKESLN